MDSGDPASSLGRSRRRIEYLRSEGQRLHASLTRSPDDRVGLATLPVWQKECAAAISQLSGGSKAHWLSRELSDAILVPSAGVEPVSIATIVGRILRVLERAAASLASAAMEGAPQAGETPRSDRFRFSFIQDEALRASLERAYSDGSDAFSREEFTLALVTFCSILEAVITNALQKAGPEGLSAPAKSAGPMATWSFTTRIEVAERSRLISRGCARLPPVARNYRGLLNAEGDIVPGTSVSPLEAKAAGDVLHVILRDLTPGR
jgi:hypothetical protein